MSDIAPNYPAGIREARRIPLAVRREILHDEALCAYCGDVAMVIDHVVPVVLGGTSDRDNLAPACTWCNDRKGAHTVDEWQEKCLDRGQPWPPLSWPKFIEEFLRRYANFAP